MFKNSLKKINQFLLENHPNIWHLRVPYLLLSGIALHVFSFVYGYFYINKDILTSYSYFSYSGESYYVLFEITFLIIILFYWALLFYRNSVIKNYYQAGKFYTIKLFFALSSLLFFNISSFVSFQIGISVKKAQIVAKFDIVHLEKEYKFLQPLLLNEQSTNSYSLENNSVLKSKNIEYQYINNDNEYCNYSFYKDFKNQNNYNELVTYFSDIDSSLYSNIDNSTAIFFELESREVKKGCEKIFIKKIIKQNNYHALAVENHSDYTQELDRLIQDKAYNELHRRLENFKNNINQIGAITNLNSWLNISYLVKNSWINTYPFMLTYKNEYKTPMANPQQLDTVNLNLERLKEFNDYYYFDDNSFQNFIDNATKSSKYYDTFLVVFITSLIFAYFLIQFQFIDFINFAISVPIASAIFIFGIFFTIISPSFNAFLPSIYTLFWTLFALFLLKKSNKLKTKWKEVLMMLFSISLPITVLTFYAALGAEIFKIKEQVDPCDEYNQPYYSFHSPAFYEWHFIILGILSCCMTLYFVKKMKAKAE